MFIHGINFLVDIFFPERYNKKRKALPSYQEGECNMEVVYQGKTKDVYRLQDGNYLLKFKDDVTGADGVFDPGANTVGLSIEGVGQGNLRMTEYFFQILREKGIPTHFISADIEKAEMTVLPATPFGNGLEIICRFRAVGSFLRRWGAYATEGQPLDAFVEVTLKDDQRGDPPITKDALQMLGLLSYEEYETLKSLTQQISTIIKEDLAQKGLELYDIKLEFGRNNGKIILIDEISSGNMRVYQNGKAVDPLELIHLVLSK
jgi:phosphoribosylaminoimidazole-succinocarboxamide synthase